MSSKDTEVTIERARCIYCGAFFRTDEYDDICIHCELKRENGEKLTANFEPEVLAAKIIEPEFKKDRKISLEESLNKTYGKYEPLKNRPKSLEHEKIESNYSHYFIGRYIPKYRNPDLFSKKIYPRFKSPYKELHEPEANEFAELLINGIKYNEIECDVVIPVPSSSGMVKSGQQLLTKILARELDIEYGINILKRVKKIPKSKFSGKDRPTLEEHLASLICEDKVSGKRVLLFDDIYTSGNTVRSCITRLKENMASDVTVITLAKTIGW